MSPFTPAQREGEFALVEPTAGVSDTPFDLLSNRLAFVEEGTARSWHYYVHGVHGVPALFSSRDAVSEGPVFLRPVRRARLSWRAT